MKEWLYAFGEYADAARDRHADAIWISGREKHSGEPLSVFYFGSGRSFDHLMDKLYAGYATYERCDEDRPMWSARRALAAPGPVDLVIGDLPWPYYHLVSSTRYVHIPGWIVQKLSLPATWEDVVGRFRKNTRSTDLRKIRKNKLEFRVTRDREAIERFYDSMYLPYTERRFAGLAVIDDREEIVGLGVTGGLLQVMQGERVLAAVVLTKWKQSMHFLWFGLPDGLDESLADGALSGLYYFTIQHAHAQGCNEVNFSYTIPLLNDGIYRYKRKWGAGVHAWPFGRMLVRPLNFGPAVESFFVHQPLVAHGRGGLVGKVMVADGALTVEGAGEIRERYLSDGLQTLQIYSARPLSSQDAAIDLSRSSDAVAAFCAGT